LKLSFGPFGAAGAAGAAVEGAFAGLCLATGSSSLFSKAIR